MITKLRLADVGLFDRTRPLSVDLGARVVAVTGANGSGKSTLVATLAYLLGGDPAAAAGLAALAAGDAAQPEAEVVFTPGVDGDAATLFRTLPGPDKNRRARRRLAYRELSLVTERDVAAELERVFGMPPRTFVGHAVVRQGELARLVDDDPAVRKKAIGKLLGLDHAERVWDLLAAEGRTVVSTSEALSAELEGRLAETTAALLAAEDALAALPPAPRPEEIAAAEAAAAEMLACQRGAAERDRHCRDAAAADRFAAETRGVCDQIRRALAAFSGSPAEYDSLRDWVPTVKEYRRLYALLEQLRGQYQAIVVPPHPGPEPAPDAALVAARAQSGVWRKLARLETGGDCPTCRRPLTGEFAALVHEARRGLDALAADETAWAACLLGYRQALAAHEQAVAARRHIEVQGKSDLARLASLPAAAAAESHSDAELDARLTQVRNQAREYAQAMAALPENEAALAAATARAEAARAAAAGLPEMPDPLVVALAQDYVKELRRRSEARVLAEAAVATHTRRLADDRAACERDRDRRAAAAPARAWAGRAGRLRAAFHRDAAPAALVARYLREQDGLDRALERLAAPFRAEVLDDCGFRAHFADGSPSVPHERLSGGLKLVLAWAYVMARSERHGERLWLTVLDEPTYGLDSVRSQALNAAVDAWRSGGPGRQLILVTHDRRLADAADRVVDLG